MVPRYASGLVGFRHLSLGKGAKGRVGPAIVGELVVHFYEPSMYPGPASIVNMMTRRARSSRDMRRHPRANQARVLNLVDSSVAPTAATTAPQTGKSTTNPVMLNHAAIIMRLIETT
jgi:hypothetical protein